jgi:hypothetical protein
MQVKNDNFYSKFNHHKMLMVDLGSSDPVSRKIMGDILREPNKEKGPAFSLGDRRTSPNS